MKDKWMLIVIAVLLVSQLVMTWIFVFDSWRTLRVHENALRNHAGAIQQLMQQGGKKK